MNVRYKCLILDHDDTAVQSTEHIHYPSFVEVLQTLRPSEKVLTFEEFVMYCYEPGFIGLCKDVLKFTEEEYEKQQQIWHTHTAKSIPSFYMMFPEVIREFKERGGIVTVLSQSESSRIIRDYKHHCGFEPDVVYGWDMEPEYRKPHPYGIQQILKQFDLQPEEVLMVDDMKPAIAMAKSCGVEFAAAGWGHHLPVIKENMKIESDYYFETVEQFRNFLFHK